MSDAGKKRRSELPVYHGGMQCPEFMRLGYCSLFNRTGRCSLSHPRKAHRLKDPAKICCQCTIPWPCNHCSYSDTRNKLNGLIHEVRRRFDLLNTLTSPLPPQDLTIKMVFLFYFILSFFFLYNFACHY